MDLRPVCTPLITVDPFFSVWSDTDNLYDDTTRHWTGRTMNMCGMIKIDGKVYKFMGMQNPSNIYYTKEANVIKQKSVKVYPMHTEYVFENETVVLNLNFLTPLLLNKLEIMSRPVSYIYYNIEVKDKKEHDIEMYFDVSTQFCINKLDSKVKFEKHGDYIRFGKSEQNVLYFAADSCCIDWGYMYLAHENCNAEVLGIRKHYETGKTLRSNIDFDLEYDGLEDAAVLYTTSKKLSDVITLAYDDVKSIQYFGKNIDAYYIKQYKTFENMLKCAVSDFEEVKEEALKQEKEIIKDAKKVSDQYADLISLSYRQAIGAHKAAVDENGDVLFLSKECHSNGCIATVDVTYPSIPMFLRYNPELVKGMIRPIMKYNETDMWPYEFAPHDCGRYPLCNGQVYSMYAKIGGEIKTQEDIIAENRKRQMPVEECGNMLIIFAAIEKWGNDKEYAAKYKDVLKRWVDYLVENGYNPDFQLCTDDFAGKLAHNCNLSLKAILGIASYAKMFGDEKYMDIAKEYAKKWEEDTKTKDATALTFDTKDTWSLKYNIVWDRLLDLHIFNPEVSKREIAFYLTKLNRYGVPLDSRKDYTKIDWLAWTTVMCDDKKYTEKIYDCVWNFLNESTDRVPITDWYYTTSGDQANHITTKPQGYLYGFRNRTVLGGVFINLLTDK